MVKITQQINIYFLNQKTNTMKEQIMQQLKDLHFAAYLQAFDMATMKSPSAPAIYADICKRIDELHLQLVEDAHIVNLTNQTS